MRSVLHCIYRPPRLYSLFWIAARRGVSATRWATASRMVTSPTLMQTCLNTGVGEGCSQAPGRLLAPRQGQHCCFTDLVQDVRLCTCTCHLIALSLHIATNFEPTDKPNKAVTGGLPLHYLHPF